MKKVRVIGGGLAGVEAAWQLASRGVAVDLYEMRPQVPTSVHETGLLAEMVCSNSLGATEIHSAAGLLKEELRLLDSLILEQAALCRVPAGSSFSVDRLRLAELLTEKISGLPGVRLIREEARDLPAEETVILASGPLTSPDLAHSISRLTMRRNLFFFDATSPIVRAETLDQERMFRASRYEKGDADFLNIALDEQAYRDFVSALTVAETVPIKDFESDRLFEACLPVEEIARRGEMTLAFGPLKPVGFSDPKDGVRPFAVVQLRQDDLNKDFYQLVGFQTRLKRPEQKRVFRMLPGLEKAEFERFGRMHRNTYVNAPLIVDDRLRCRQRSSVRFCGQLSGVEGYLESIASGLACGIFTALELQGLEPPPLPRETALGSLIYTVCNSGWQDFKPTKFSFGLLPAPAEKIRDKKERKENQAALALENMRKWSAKHAI